MGYIVAYLLSGALSDYVFEPFMRGNSLFANNIQKVIGNGSGRGIALLILIAGIALAIIGIVVSRLNSVKSLEGGISENETIAEACSEGL